jgi:hypothetical protein
MVITIIYSYVLFRTREPVNNAASVKMSNLAESVKVKRKFQSKKRNRIAAAG